MAGERSTEERQPARQNEADYFFEQFRVAQGCLGYRVADPETGLAAVVDPEAGMVEPMLDAIFEHGFRPA